MWGCVAKAQLTGNACGDLGRGFCLEYEPSFRTADDRHEIAVIANRYWRALGAATSLNSKFEMVGLFLDGGLPT